MWAGGWVVGWSGGRVAGWPGGQVAKWPGGQVAGWPGGRVAGWPVGPDDAESDEGDVGQIRNVGESEKEDNETFPRKEGVYSGTSTLLATVTRK